MRGNLRRELYQFANIAHPRRARSTAPFQPALGPQRPGLSYAITTVTAARGGRGDPEPGPHGTIIARWPYRLDSGRRVTLHASLVERGTELVVCEWDLADL